LLIATGGDFGEWPEIFNDHDVAEIWHCKPSEAREESLQDYEVALLRRSIISEGRADYARNQRERPTE
jgi:hypothetical protein